MAWLVSSPEKTRPALAGAAARPHITVGHRRRRPRNPNMQTTSPSAPLRVLTTHKVFGPFVNFDFLIEKATHELNLSFAEGVRGAEIFYWHAMNFSVSIHSIADYLWWVKASSDPQWHKCQNDLVNCRQLECQNAFVNWVTTKNDCISAFLDLSNTYKHSERARTHNVKSLHIYEDHEIIKNSDPPDELEIRNCIIGKAQAKDAVSWPVIMTEKGRLIYYRYAAESALDWWRQYERQ